MDIWNTDVTERCSARRRRRRRRNSTNKTDRGEHVAQMTRKQDIITDIDSGVTRMMKP